MRLILPDLEQLSGEQFFLRNLLEQFSASIGTSWDVEHANAGHHVFPSGTWTPVIGGSGGTSGQVYSLQEGEYVLLGDLVMAHVRVTLSTEGTITGNVEIQGLPYRVTYRSLCALAYEALATNWVTVMALAQVNQTTAAVVGAQAAAASNTTALTAAAIGNTTHFHGTLIYRTTR